MFLKSRGWHVVNEHYMETADKSAAIQRTQGIGGTVYLLWIPSVRPRGGRREVIGPFKSAKDAAAWFEGRMSGREMAWPTISTPEAHGPVAETEPAG